MVPGSKKSKSSPVEKHSPSVDNFGKDLLLQIFLRLPDCQSAIRCLAVSKLWYSLVSDHHFICSFIHRQKLPNSGSMLYTLLLQFSNAPSSSSFFVTPFILHQRRLLSLSYSYYLSLLPIPLINVRAYFKNLLFVSDRSRFTTSHYVCNVLARKFIALPDAPKLGVFFQMPRDASLPGSDWHGNAQPTSIATITE